MKGICCECQAMQNVYRSNGGYLMDDHEIPGTTLYCKGSGTVPQAIIVNKLEEANDQD